METRLPAKQILEAFAQSIFLIELREGNDWREWSQLDSWEKKHCLERAAIYTKKHREINKGK